MQTAASGASCGIELEVGRRTGLFLDRERGAWLGSLCGQIEPARLLEAARPLPAPNGRGPIALLVGGAFGPARTIGLDRLGRTLVYGRGEGETTLLAVCPGARRVVEVVWLRQGWTVAVRDLRTARVVRSRRLAAARDTYPHAAGCADRSGAAAFVFTTSLDGPDRARVVRVAPGGSRTVWAGTATAASFAGAVAYVNRGPRGRDVAALELASGTVRPVARVPEWTGALVRGPDGSLAGVAYRAPLRLAAPPSRLVLVEPDTGRVRSTSLGSANVSGELVWLDARRLAFFPEAELTDARVYDLALRVRSRIRPWRARDAAVVGSTAYGVAWTGELSRAALPRGPVERVRMLPSPVVRTLVAVP